MPLSSLSKNFYPLLQDIFCLSDTVVMITLEGTWGTLKMGQERRMPKGGHQGVENRETAKFCAKNRTSVHCFLKAVKPHRNSKFKNR